MSVKNSMRCFVSGCVAVVASVCLLAGCGPAQPAPASSKKSSASSVPSIPVEYDWHGFDIRKSGAGVHPEITSQDEACRKVASEAVYWVTAKDGKERYRQLFKRFYLREKDDDYSPWYVGDSPSDFTHIFQPPYRGETGQKFDNKGRAIQKNDNYDNSPVTCSVYITKDEDETVGLMLSKPESQGWSVDRFYWPKEYYKGDSNQNFEF